ncbi:hypothetical protein ACFY3J_22375 [Streptomyces sp. NPDC001231]|uniref:hypothetical protein n=1 Tax=Streptomyces sp. NPDC001231 TaxID=3364549 RepID=UPI0036C05CC7
MTHWKIARSTWSTSRHGPCIPVRRRAGRGGVTDSRPVDAESVERSTEALAATTGFAEVEHTLELTGVCRLCQSRATPSHE